MYRDIAHAVYKRGESQLEGYELPTWTLWLVLLNIVIFVPLVLMTNYTFSAIIPTLAIIEDPSPPAYEPISLNDDDAQSLPEEQGVPKLANERGLTSSADTRAVTSSLRATLRTLTGISGFISLFRGLGCYIAMSFGTIFIAMMFISFLPALVVVPIAGVLALQLYTTWVHIVISAPSPKTFWQRIPPFKRSFKAVALPTALVFLAAEITRSVPRGLCHLLGMTTWNPSQPDAAPAFDSADAWKGLLVLVTGILLHIFVSIPAQVVLTRVQASLLPEEDETIVPFDRAFQGKLEPAIVGGAGYVSVKNAWATFSRASWIRLVKLYAKIFVATMAIGLMCTLIIIPQVVLIAKHTERVN